MPKGILVNFENSFKLKKIPCMPPIYHDNNYITDFKEKAQIFNNFFTKQCTLVENTSKLPIDSFKRTNNLLSSLWLWHDQYSHVKSLR